MSETASHDRGMVARRTHGAEWLRTPMPALFLRLEIGRGHVVTRQPSFAYPVVTDFFPVGQPLSYQLEFVDGDGASLGCTSLREDCWHCDGACWPKHVRQVVPYPAHARGLRVLHDETEVYAETIPDPPKLNLKCSYDVERERIHLSWTASGPGSKAGDGEGLWFLVQYRSHGAWRGLAPRTRAASADVDLKRLSLPVDVPLRVLATSGVATGVGMCLLEPGPPPKPTEGVLIATTGEPATDQPVSIPGRLRVHAVDHAGRSLPGTEIRWYDEAGRELARGREMDPSLLGSGQHVIHAVARGSGTRPIDRTFLVHQVSGGHCELAASRPGYRGQDSPTHLHRDGSDAHVD